LVYSQDPIENWNWKSALLSVATVPVLNRTTPLLSSTKIAGPFIVILWLACPTIAQQSPKPFSVAKSFPDPIEAASFEFSAGGFQYNVAENGIGHRSANNQRTFNLRLARHDYLMRELYFAEYEGDLLLIAEVSNGEYGMGFIARLDGTTLRMKWKRVIPGFNVGRGLLDGAYVYVTGIGFVGKVNLQSGAYAWRHENLYRRTISAFNAFELPEVEGDVVIFREAAHYLRKKIAVIRVQRRRGKIISIIT